MKTAKARVFTFDVECPECGGLLRSPERDGYLAWSIHKAIPRTGRCVDCGVESKIPKRVAGRIITPSGAT